MKRARLNYWVDVGVGVSFALSAISGLVFLLPMDSNADVLGLGYPAWSRLHTWSSLALIAGVLVHLVLHWQWIVSMTGKMLSFGNTIAQTSVSHGAGISRRRFLVLGLAAAATGIIAAGSALLAGTGLTGVETKDSGDEAPEDRSAQPAQPRDSVACPRGMVNDPYPGHCRQYIDRNGDGICDYSVPGSG